MQRTQIKVVGSQVIGWEAGRPRGLGGLQCRLNHPGNADRYLVLKLEHIFERAVKAIGPEMGPGSGVDQLCGDPNSIAALSNAAFEDIADAKIAPNLFYAG